MKSPRLWTKRTTILRLREDPLPGFVHPTDVITAASEALRPPKKITVSEWAEAHRVLKNPGGYSGPWLNSITPYLVEPMDRRVQNPMTKPEFKSEDQFEVQGKTVFSVALDRETSDFGHLRNRIVFIDGREYRCVAIERFTHMPPWRKGEKIGLMVEDPEAGA